MTDSTDNPLPVGAASESPAQSASWASTASSLLPWMVPALLTLHMKRYMMVRGQAYQLVARLMGRSDLVIHTGLSRGEEFSFYRADLLISGLVVPLALLLLVRWMPRNWRVPFVAIVSGVVASVLYVQLRSLEEMGRYLTLDSFTAALSWGWHEPLANTAYLGSQGVITVIAPVLYIAGAWWLSSHMSRDVTKQGKNIHRKYAKLAILFCGLLGFTAAAWATRIPATPYHDSVLIRSFGALWGDQEIDPRDFDGLSDADLIRRYRDLIHATVSGHDPRYWGRERGANVLFFVMETMPARFLPPDGGWEDLPNLRRLRERSFVPLEHYTTYPLTDHAVFSLFSSWYPAGGIKLFERRHADTLVPGVIRTLADSGYRTVMYHPDSWTGLRQGSMFKALGFQENRSPDTDSAIVGKLGLNDWKKERVAADRAAIEALKGDLAEFGREKKGFGVAIFPQIGHGPWPDDGAHGGEADLLHRAHAIVATQDAWLGEILSALERAGEQENTIIVVCGDHGVRSRVEDPDFVGGLVDEESFHVPLLIYAPRALDHEEKIPLLTSHIDVAPSVLDLLGVDKGREPEQGAPLWEPAIQQRTTFFFAAQMLGGDGYYSAGNFFMWSQVTGGVARSSRPHFLPADFVPPNSPDALNARRELLRMLALQEVWISRLGKHAGAVASK